MTTLLAVSALSFGTIVQSQTASPFVYPEARKTDVAYDYAGNKVADPYSWLEDLDSTETQSWCAAESKLAYGYLRAIPGRDRIARREKRLISYERYSAPSKEGGRYFFTRQRPGQNQPVLYVTSSLASPAHVLLDPNKLSKDGTVALSGTAVSHDGKWLAYSLSSSGSDWQEWRVRNVATQSDTHDDVKWSKFSGASWTKDGLGFFYSRFDEPTGNSMKDANYNQKLFFHRLGTPQTQDVLAYERPDHPDWGFEGTVSEDGKYLVINAWHGTQHENRTYYRELWPSGQIPKEAKGNRLDLKRVLGLFPNGDAEYVFLGNRGRRFYFRTDKQAPLGRVVALDLPTVNSTRPRAGGTLTSVVPESKDALSGASIVGGKVFATYLKDAHGLVKVYDLKGRHLRDVGLPGIGSVGGFGGKMNDSETFYTYSSYTTPATIYRYDVVTGHSTVFRRPAVPFDGAKFETKQVFFKSKDGARIPMFLTYRKGLKLDGQNPTLIYGYGGFNVNEEPGFASSRALWLEMGGVYADVVLRGGSEYGEPWHKAGMLHNKQNVFNDFISAAEWLIANRWTSTRKLACQGGSNGGLLIGAAETQRPDLWGATIPEVGVMDMLRFNKFTIGHAWMSEYGNPDTVADFANIFKYSPLHNIRAGTSYPPTLIETADHDDRVFPAHSFKFAAAMQAAQAGPAPILIRIESKAGHGAGKPISKQIEAVADEWAFLLENLHMTLPPGFGR